MLKILFLISLFCASHAFANVSGQWQGSGQWMFEGSAVPCRLTMSFEETETELRRLGGTLDCQYVAMYSDPLTWTKEGSALLLDGKTAGSWHAKGFVSQELADQNVEVKTSFNVETGVYQEIWRRLDNDELIYKIDANLNRK